MMTKVGLFKIETCVLTLVSLILIFLASGSEERKVQNDDEGRSI